MPKKTKLLDQPKETPVPDDAPALWVYMIAKIDRYFSLGADKYRKLDALQMPDAAWDEDTLKEVLGCFQQFAAGKGYRDDRPTENVSIGGFYAAMKTLHFNLVQQKATLPKKDKRHIGQLAFVDKMLFKHVMTEQSLWLFNRVEQVDLE